MLPDYLMSTYTLLKNTYNEGIPEDEYYSILFLLYDHMSHRNLAEVISYFTKKQYAEVLNNVFECVTNKKPIDEKVNFTKLKLLKNGYEKWLEEE